MSDTTRRTRNNLLRGLPVLTLLLAACGEPAPTGRPVTARPEPPASLTPARAAACPATVDDGRSPTYRPDAPVRSSVGRGHLVKGTVFNSSDCSPVAGAKIELWPEASGGGHPDQWRATVFTDSQGRYSFECGPTDHIHMRVSAGGFKEIFTNQYHPPAGQAEGVFDIVLVRSDN